MADDGCKGITVLVCKPLTEHHQSPIAIRASVYELFCGVSMSSTGISCVHCTVCQYIQQKKYGVSKWKRTLFQLCVGGIP